MSRKQAQGHAEYYTQKGYMIPLTRGPFIGYMAGPLDDQQGCDKHVRADVAVLGEIP